MSERMTPEQRADLRAAAELAHHYGGIEQELGDGVLDLLAEVERLETALAASESTLAGLRRVQAETVERYQQAEAALADAERENAQLVETIRELEIRAADKDAQRVAEREARLEAQREARSEWETQAATIRLIDEKWHAAEARAEQAERQVREIREAWPCDNYDAPHDCIQAGLTVTLCNRCRAMSGVSGPTTEGASE